MMETQVLYKSLQAGLKSQYDGHQWKLGEWYKTNCVKLCHGFNCSTRIIDALRYVNLENLAIVETKGKHFLSDDKQTWESMRLTKAWVWKKEDSVALAIFAAELVIDIFENSYPNDMRPRRAIEAAKKYHTHPDAARAAAEAAEAVRAAEAAQAAWAAWAAARAAAWAAKKYHTHPDAAEAARAAEAVRAAAWAAARAADAAEAAEATRAGKILDQCEVWILARINALEEIKP